MNGPIHTWFELSYSQYLTVPRAALHSMPEEWQARFVKCLEELDATFDWRPGDGKCYRCTLHKPDEDYLDQLRDDGYELDTVTLERYWGPALSDPLANYRRVSMESKRAAPAPKESAGPERGCAKGGGE